MRSPPRPGGEASVDALEVSVIAFAVVLVCTVMFGLPLAMAGRYVPTVVPIVGAGIGGTVCLAGASWLRRNRIEVRWRDWTLLVPVVLVGIMSVWSSGRTGQTLLLNRDPASYANTARWLDREGSLTFDASRSVFDGLPGVRYAGPAVYDVGDGDLEFQFAHGPSVVFTSMFRVLGARGLFTTNVLIGAAALLVWYCLMRRIGVGIVISLGAIAAFGLSIPYLQVTRATYSEPLVLLVVGGAVWALTYASQSSSPTAPTMLAGFLAAASVLFRIDGLIYVAALFIAVSVPTLRGVPRIASAAVAGASLPAIVGLVDQYVFTGDYVADRASSVVPLTGAALASLGVLAIAVPLGRRRPVANRVSVRWARAVAAGTSLLVVGVWLVRPRVEKNLRSVPVDHPGYRMVEGIQTRDGLTIDPTRGYAEQSLSQIAWYVGVPVLVAAVVGVGLLVYRALTRPGSKWEVLLLFAIVATPVYLWRPSIFPDHPWMSRRYVPFVLPIILLTASLALQRLVDGVRSSVGDRAGHAVSVVAALALVVPAVNVTWPVRDMTDQRGVHGMFVETCRVVTPGSNVLTVDTPTADMALRAWCGADVASASWDAVEEFAARASTTCVPAFIVVPGGKEVETSSGLIGAPIGVSSATWKRAEPTLTRPPDRLLDVEASLTIWPIASDPSCAEA